MTREQLSICGLLIPIHPINGLKLYKCHFNTADSFSQRIFSDKNTLPVKLYLHPMCLFLRLNYVDVFCMTTGLIVFSDFAFPCMYIPSNNNNNNGDHRCIINTARREP